MDIHEDKLQVQSCYLQKVKYRVKDNDVAIGKKIKKKKE